MGQFLSLEKSMNLDDTEINNLDYFIENTTTRVIETKDDGHQCQIALGAYFKAERRGFAPGHELDDWLEAEHDIMGNP